MGDDTAHWEVFWWIPTQCGLQDDGTETAEGVLWNMDVYPSGRGNVDYGVTGSGGLRLPPT